MTREASAAMRKLVEAFDSATRAEHGTDLRRKFFGDDWSQDVVEPACASRTALLAAIAAQEAVSEAAQAEVARLRQIAVDARSRIAELTAEAAADPRRYPALAVTWLTWVATQIEGAALKEPT